MMPCFVPTKVQKKARSLAATSLFCFLVLTLLTQCGRNERTQIVVQGATMGTTYSVKVAGLKSQLPQTELLQKIIDGRLADINQTMSTYIDDSELQEFNRAKTNVWHIISPELYEILNLSLDYSFNTTGAFDVTVAPLVDLWGFGPEKKGDVVPTDAEIFQAKRRVGYDNLVLRKSDKKASKLVDLQIDLSAIAKGYAVDEIAKIVMQMHLFDFMVEIGGELRLSGLNAEGNRWRIGLESPTDNLEKSALKTLVLSGVGMATSGDYRNYFEVDGKRFSHTINPVTGTPIEHKLASVTVVADTAVEADAMATALNVLGPVNGFNYAKYHKLAAYFIVREGDGFETKYTPSFARYLEDNQSAQAGY